LRQLLDDATYWAAHGTYTPSEPQPGCITGSPIFIRFQTGTAGNARIMADAVLDRIYKAKPIDWAGGYDLQKMNEPSQRPTSLRSRPRTEANWAADGIHRPKR